MRETLRSRCSVRAVDARCVGEYVLFYDNGATRIDAKHISADPVTQRKVSIRRKVRYGGKPLGPVKT